MGDKVRTLRISEEASRLLDENNKRHGDISYHTSNAIIAYFNQGNKSQPAVGCDVYRNSPAVKEKPAQYSQEHLDFAKWAFDCIRNTMDGVKEPNFEAWAKDVRLMIERDNRNIDDMANIWQWARNDHFWQSNILSISKFRKQYDTLKAQSMRPVKTGGTQFKTAQEKRAERNAEIFDYDKATDF